MYLLLVCLILVSIPFQNVLAKELCKDKEWYHESGECRPCTVCRQNHFELAPCLPYSDTFCVNLIEIGRSINMDLKAGSGHHKWHEMEGSSDIDNNALLAKEKILSSKSTRDDYDSLWSQVICVVLSVTTICITALVLMVVIRYIRNAFHREHRNNVARSRLFSRDRLNTTEYMNNLATLDRRLAIDEILEKRKRAIFEPQLLHENVYTDEVFIDISGVPRNLRDDHPYEELDLRKCLLQMKDQQ